MNSPQQLHEVRLRGLAVECGVPAIRHGPHSGMAAIRHGPASGANEFAAGTAQSPPARTTRASAAWLQRVRRERPIYLCPAPMSATGAGRRRCSPRRRTSRLSSGEFIRSGSSLLAGLDAPPPPLTSSHILSHPLTSSHILSHPLTSSHILSHPLTSSHILSRPLTSSHILSHPLAAHIG
jgi:hypothetical protein